MGRVASTECNRQGPDYFGLFASEVAELISQDEDFLPISDQIFEKSGKVNGVVEEKNSSMNSYIAKEFRYTGGSASLFSDCFGAHVSNFGKERLKLLLRQSVVALSQEVDEILDPVFSICQLRSCLRYKESLLAVPGPVSNSDQGNHPQKKLKASPLSDSEREDLNISPSRGDTTNDVKKLEGEQVNDSLAKKDQNVLGSNDGATPEDGDVHNDLQFLLQNDSAKVESLIEKHCDELVSTLGYMEEKLEELLDIVMSNCRLMTFPEKQHLRQLIRDLPPKNLDRVVQIFCRGKQVERHSCSEVYVDLENEDKATLWRLYFYIETVENAKRLCEV
ncbi:uncharacterized protein LOC107009116 isoform X1 [Solanum pennellii]|uniref:Uncharacterized protein LOC107009116 isoform X1 n=1 Tax=Solanum pennellii TaxID=28526 RepID=A0ABM1FZN3_SOLPN|nr:uncharacterized protein LOC107009116 isoform X1 [Solanum pennellii]XP_015063878.1 uncharacterized protein LOC107009116 isoform X1 [Solanum pennellii]